LKGVWGFAPNKQTTPLREAALLFLPVWVPTGIACQYNENDIETIEQPHETASGMNRDYCRLRRDVVSSEQRMAVLSERLKRMCEERNRPSIENSQSKEIMIKYNSDFEVTTD
jgi:hypothetical protein